MTYWKLILRYWKGSNPPATKSCSHLVFLSSSYVSICDPHNSRSKCQIGNLFSADTELLLVYLLDARWSTLVVDAPQAESSDKTPSDSSDLPVLRTEEHFALLIFSAVNLGNFLLFGTFSTGFSCSNWLFRLNRNVKGATKVLPCAEEAADLLIGDRPINESLISSPCFWDPLKVQKWFFFLPVSRVTTSHTQKRRCYSLFSQTFALNINLFKCKQRTILHVSCFNWFQTVFVFQYLTSIKAVSGIKKKERKKILCSCYDA